MNKVFGIGWAKTGTTTLGTCFKVLGYDHQSQKLDLVEGLKTNDLSKILEIAHVKTTFEDWPWLLLYKEFDKKFPNSKFILTIRSSQNWVKSYQNMLKNQSEASSELNRIRQVLYGLNFPEVTESQLIERYERHNREVIDYFKGREADLLILNWEQNASWDKLCFFLDKPIPNEPFPHANKGNYKFIRRLCRKFLKKS